MPTLGVRDVQAAPGAKAYGALHVGEWADGSPIGMPVAIANGRKDGPVLLIIAAMHGDEMVGTEAARRMIAELDPEQMGGGVVAILAANVPAFLLGTRVNTIEDPAGWNDLKKLIRTAQPNGSLTERLASVMRDEIVPLCEYYVDLHSSARGSVNYPRAISAGDYLEISTELRKKVDLLAEACDFEYVFKPRSETWKGMYFVPQHPLEEDHGKAGIILETGYAPTMEGVDLLMDGIRNILGAIGVLADGFERTKPLTYIERLIATRANRGGMWHPKVGIPVEVEEGELLGEITNFQNEVVEEIKAPEAGIVIKVATTATVVTGVRTHVLGITA